VAKSAGPVSPPANFTLSVAAAPGPGPAQLLTVASQAGATVSKPWGGTPA
jgi:hypothetical protein